MEEKDSISVKFVTFFFLKDKIIKKPSLLSAHIVGKHSKKLKNENSSSFISAKMTSALFISITSLL